MSATAGFVCGAALIIGFMSLFSGWMLWLAANFMVPGIVNFYVCWFFSVVAHVCAMCLSIYNK